MFLLFRFVQLHRHFRPTSNTVSFTLNGESDFNYVPWPMQVKDPVVHNTVRWITEILK